MFKQPIDRESFKIETQKFILSPITTQYVQNIFIEFNEEITKYMYPIPAKEISETLDWIKRSIEKNMAGKNIQLVILDKNTKEFIGCVGLHEPETNTPELGIWIKKAFHGKKYGFEATKLLKQRADENMIFEYLIYPVDRRNISSCKIPQRLSGTTDGIITLSKTPDPNKILESITYKIYSK